MAHQKQAVISCINLYAALRQQYSFDAISLVPNNLYGPGDNYHHINSHVLPAMIRRFHAAKDFQLHVVAKTMKL
jgi:GDP-L-fucose synthase